jgi:PAS domain S-box-containing protein
LRGEPYDIEHRIVVGDTVKWVREKAEPEVDPDGTMRGGFGTVQDITARKAADRALERQARLLDAIVENTRTHLAYLDPALRFVRVNSTYAASTGHSRTELLGRRIFDLFPQPETERIFAEVRDTGLPVQFTEKHFEFPDRPEGATLRWDWTLTPVKDERERVEGLVLSLTDVTQQVQQRERLLAAERARVEIAEHLNDEIAHRVKNNLAVISGLLEVQALSEVDQRSAVAVALRQAVARLRTFAYIHERMYSSRTDSVDLRDILEQICVATKQIFATRAEVAIGVEGVAFPCHARVATNLSVIANELVTNALKHGAPSDGGAMNVEVKLRQDDAQLVLSVWNAGNPVTADFEVRGHRSMGLRLVWDMVARQYQGTFCMRPERGGTLAQVMLPRARLKADERPR